MAVMTESVRMYSLSGVIVENSEVAAADIMLRSVPSIYCFCFVCVAEPTIIICLYPSQFPSSSLTSVFIISLTATPSLF